MKRVAKPEGEYNIVIEDVPLPEISSTQVLIRAECSLISRGSEIWRRYIRSEAIDHQSMGYSFVGDVVEVGARVSGFSIGDRVAALAPHAEYVAVEIVDSRHVAPVVHLPDAVSSEAATFWPLSTSSVLWMREIEARKEDTVAILGQGLVGSICMQALNAEVNPSVIAVDALPLRCQLAASLGADHVVDASREDPVRAVNDLTGGAGVEVAVEAVGGRAGAAAFAQAQDMVKRGGLIQVIGLYEDEPLPLDSGKIQGRRIVGGYSDGGKRSSGSDRALQLLAQKKIRAEEMISHRFPYQEAAEAFDLLYTRLGETMGVVLVWK
ncbi:MAG: zinc-binding dehydrogenase [Gemmatimonadota bacterium]|nr:zinc-binding dehydrogenase [Gemmatimonadota bacterium]